MLYYHYRGSQILLKDWKMVRMYLKLQLFTKFKKKITNFIFERKILTWIIFYELLKSEESGF